MCMIDYWLILKFLVIWINFKNRQMLVAQKSRFLPVFMPIDQASRMFRFV